MIKGNIYPTPVLPYVSVSGPLVQGVTTQVLDNALTRLRVTDNRDRDHEVAFGTLLSFSG